METAFVVVLAALGMYNSVYFTLLAYRLVPPSARLVPAVCRLEDSACDAVVHTPPARLIGGIPNALLGIVYYMAIFIAAATNALWRLPVTVAFAAAGALTVALGAYLAYELIAVMRVRCVLCMASHGMNAALFAVFAWKSGAPFVMAI